MKLRRIGAAVAGALAAGLILVPASFGQSEVVTATIVDGTRVLVPGAGVILNGNRTVVSGAYSVTVTETASGGSQANGNGWAVTASLSNFTGATSGATIPASAVTAKARTVHDGLGTTNFYTIHGGQPGVRDASFVGDGGNFGTPQTLFEIDGENAAVAYTGTFVGAGTLEMAVPSSAPGDSYTSTLTYTLID